MNEHSLAHRVLDDVAGHTEEPRGLAAVRLLVHEVAPPPDRLAEHNVRQREVENVQKTLFLDLGGDEQRDCGGDDSAVDCEAALPDREDLSRVLLIVVELEQHVVQSRADDCRRNADDQIVQHVVRFDRVFFRETQAENDAENHAEADYQTVPVELERADPEDRSRHVFEFEPQVRERHEVVLGREKKRCRIHFDTS